MDNDAVAVKIELKILKIQRILKWCPNFTTWEFRVAEEPETSWAVGQDPLILSALVM